MIFRWLQSRRIFVGSVVVDTTTAFCILYTIFMLQQQQQLLSSTTMTTAFNDVQLNHHDSFRIRRNSFIQQQQQQRSDSIFASSVISSSSSMMMMLFPATQQRRRRLLQQYDPIVALYMSSKNRVGLEQRRESATPTAGGMTFYVKAGPDGISLGDCPFAHYVRMVLEVKGLEYELKPSIHETKPSWLIEYYDGKMPALRHQKECYVESDTIAAYLEFFFPTPALTPDNDREDEAATTAVDGLFPALAQYIKHTPDGDEVDIEKKEQLRSILIKLNDHLSVPNRTGPYLVGNGNTIRMNDCKLIPILYHMNHAIPVLKGETTFLSLMNDIPDVKKYMDYMFQNDPIFPKTIYPPEVVVWGWNNARGK